MARLALDAAMDNRTGTEAGTNMQVCRLACARRKARQDHCPTHDCRGRTAAQRTDDHTKLRDCQHQGPEVTTCLSYLTCRLPGSVPIRQHSFRPSLTSGCSISSRPLTQPKDLSFRSLPYQTSAAMACLAFTTNRSNRDA